MPPDTNDGNECRAKPVSRLSGNAGDARYACALRALNEGFVERDKNRAGGSTSPVPAWFVAQTSRENIMHSGLAERCLTNKFGGHGTSQMHGVREFNAVGCERKRCGHGRFILSLHVLEAEQLRKCVPNRGLLKPVQTSEHPAGFEQYSFRDPDRLAREQRSRSAFNCSGFVVWQAMRLVVGLLR